ncbi:MAG TPA: tRNA (adenosine(37)-N6)-threonylcarbamoyltransferase complex dimerization subunit type 1 TsaB, partial [Planctomycetota bacterium]|nr:tRNA (adenosine(37)-N6)-threonylcarbamoyltransferase complex dimerization subunit type 1 TsaB [Planctomycetota bacterium]
MTAPPFVLALNASQDPGSVALLHGEEVLFERVFPHGARGGTEIAPAVAEALSAAPEGRVDAVAVSLGPGSYTGARVGLAWAEFFAYGRGAPLFGVSDLEALAARTARGAETLAVGLHAHDGRLYAAAYACAPRTEPRELVPPA